MKRIKDMIKNIGKKRTGDSREGRPNDEAIQEEVKVRGERHVIQPGFNPQATVAPHTLVLSGNIIGNSRLIEHALELNKNLRHLKLRNCSIRESGALAIAKVLEHVKYLDISYNELGPVGIEAIVGACKNIEHLDISHMWQTSREGYGKIVRDPRKMMAGFLKETKTLKHLNMSYNACLTFGGPLNCYFPGIMVPRYYGTVNGPGGPTPGDTTEATIIEDNYWLSGVIKENKTLEYLDVSGNDGGAMDRPIPQSYDYYIAGALRENRTLQQFIARNIRFLKSEPWHLLKLTADIKHAGENRALFEICICQTDVCNCKQSKVNLNLKHNRPGEVNAKEKKIYIDILLTSCPLALNLIELVFDYMVTDPFIYEPEAPPNYLLTTITRRMERGEMMMRDEERDIASWIEWNRTRTSALAMEERKTTSEEVQIMNGISSNAPVTPGTRANQGENRDVVEESVVHDSLNETTSSVTDPAVRAPIPPIVERLNEPCAPSQAEILASIVGAWPVTNQDFVSAAPEEDVTMQAVLWHSLNRSLSAAEKAPTGTPYDPITDTKGMDEDMRALERTNPSATHVSTSSVYSPLSLSQSDSSIAPSMTASSITLSTNTNSNSGSQSSSGSSPSPMEVDGKQDEGSSPEAENVIEIAQDFPAEPSLVQLRLARSLWWKKEQAKLSLQSSARAASAHPESEETNREKIKPSVRKSV